MKYYHSIILSALLVIPQLLFAQQISEGEAKSKALDFFNNQSVSVDGARRAPVRSSNIELAYTAGDNGTNYFYVYNNGEDGGFVIVSGDERASELLAFSNTGHFDYDKAPDNFKGWLEQSALQIEKALSLPEINKSASRAESRTQSMTSGVQKVDIPDLIKTKWNQWDPYNSAIPKLVSSIDGTEYTPPTGCVQTAVAQVMKYWEYPERGTGLGKQIINYYQIDGYEPGGSNYTPEFGVVSHSIDFESSTYDWNNMLDDYHGDETEGQITAVALLMYHTGVACQAVWGVNLTTGAYPAEGMIVHFGYSPMAKEISRDDYDDQTWEEIIYSELHNNRPVLYSGVDSHDLGHMFIVHGYNSDNDMYSVNWGWGGFMDCYCKLTPVDGGATLLGYQKHQQAVVHLQPSTMDADKSIDYGTTFWSNGIKYSVLSNYFNTVSVIQPDFEETTYVGDITIPETVSISGTDYSVVHISPFAFSGNFGDNTKDVNIEVVTIENVRYIGHHSFASSTIREAVLADNAQMGYSCFYNCYMLSNVHLPTSLTYLPDGTFESCFSLDTISLPGTLKYFGSGAFHSCTSIDDIVLPEQLDSIGDGCFKYCSKLFNIKALGLIPPTLGSDVFPSHHNFLSIYVPKSAVSSYESSPWSEAFRSICSIETPDNRTVRTRLKYNGYNFEYAITNNIAILTSGPLSDNQNRVITIPDSIHYNGNSIPVICIGESAFRGAFFKDIVLPANLEQICEHAFNSCDLERFVIPKSVRKIYNSALPDRNLNFVISYADVPPIINNEGWIPSESAVLLIPEQSFDKYASAYYWKSFKTVRAIGSVNENVGKSFKIDDYEYMISLDGVSLLHVPGVDSIIVPESVTYDNTTYLVTSVAQRAFCQYGIKYVELPNSITLLSSDAFFYCYDLESVKLGKGIKTIGNSCFNSCGNLKYLYFQEGVETIGSDAFSGCSSIRKIVFPSTIKAITLDCFNGCNELDTIVILSDSIPVDSRDKAYWLANYGWFPESALSSNCIVFVPESLLESYRNHDYWRRAKSIQSIIVPDSIKISEKELELYSPNGRHNLSAIMFPDSTLLSMLSWSSSDDRVATVDDNGTIIVQSPGTATIKVQGLYYPSLVDSCIVTVEPIPEISITMNDISISVLDKADVKVDFKSNIAISSLQFDVKLPNVLSFSNEDSVIVNRNRLIDHSVSYKVRDDGTIRFVIESLSNYNILDGTGELISFKVTPNQDVETIDSIIVSRIIVTTAEGKEYSVVDFGFSVKLFLPAFKVDYFVDGDWFASDSIKYSATIVPMESPTKEGYTFSGWSGLPETMPANDVTVTGSFTVNSYVITYVIDDEVIAQDSIFYGAEIVVPEAPEKEGYTFDGWVDVPSTMPAHDVTITGSYSVIDGIAVIGDNSSLRVYDLTGKYLGQMTESEVKMLKPGIYIVNNKKRIVK